MTTVLIRSPLLSGEVIHQIMSDMIEDINRETSATAVWESRKNMENEKGGGVEFNAIVISLISSGTLISIIEIIKSYLFREASLELSVKNSKGDEVFISVKNFSNNRDIETIASLKKILDGKE